MFSRSPYPIICAENFAQTVNFYEDHFDFKVTCEMDGFVLMKSSQAAELYVAVIDKNHGHIPERYRKTVQGMILSFPVENLQTSYDHAYWEGLTIISEPETSECGHRHFMVEDPNGILIDVTEFMPVDAGILMDTEGEYAYRA